MEKKTGTAATKAKNKYNAANYERLYPFVKIPESGGSCWVQP